MKRLFALFFIFCMIGTANKALAQEVKINTNLAVEGDGTIRMDNAATVWDDLRVSLTTPSTGALAPTNSALIINSVSGGYLNWFKTSGIDELYFDVQIPHDWKVGSDIMPHIHWVPSATGNLNGIVIWYLQYTWTNHQDVLNNYITISATQTVTPTETLIQNKHYITPLPTISGDGHTISSILVCRIYRNGGTAGDTYAGEAGALSVDFHYQRNTLGSREEYVK